MKRTPQAKSQATILVREMAAAGIPIKHQQALEMVARMSGFRDWNAMSAAPAPSVASPTPSMSAANPADSLALRKLIALATEVSDGSDSTGCEGDLTVTYESAVSKMMQFIRKLASPVYSENPASRFDPTRQVMVTWSVNDVLEVRPDLTDEEAFDLLVYTKRKHDAEQGITWDVLRDNASWLFHERKLECTVTFKDTEGNEVSKPALVELMHQGRVTVEGKPLTLIISSGTAKAKFDALPWGEDEFPVRFGRLFGQKEEDGNGDGLYKRLEATRELMANLLEEDALPSIKMD